MPQQFRIDKYKLNSYDLKRVRSKYIYRLYYHQTLQYMLSLYYFMQKPCSYLKIDNGSSDKINILIHHKCNGVSGVFVKINICCRSLNSKYEN